MDLEELIRFMSDKMRTAFYKTEIPWSRIEEIRIRTGKPIILYISNKEYVLTKEGELIPVAFKEKEKYITDENDIRQILDRLSGYSLYAYEEEMRQGFFTLEGGHRVGLAGKTVVENEKIKTIKDVGFLNIRIAHEKKNCGKRYMGNLIEDGRVKHTLILSPPRMRKNYFASGFHPSFV